MENVSKKTIFPKSSRGAVLIFAFLALVGIVIIMLSGGNGTEKDEVSFEDLDPASYAKQVEERVEALCNKIDGVSGTYAVVTLKGGYRAIYASDSQASGGSSKSQIVLIGSGAGEKGLLIGYENPEISGIGIVCSGGDDYNIRKNIIAVVSSAFNISTNKIFVSGS